MANYSGWGNQSINLDLQSWAWYIEKAIKHSSSGNSPEVLCDRSQRKRVIWMRRDLNGWGIKCFSVTDQLEAKVEEEIDPRLQNAVRHHRNWTFTLFHFRLVCSLHLDEENIIGVTLSYPHIPVCGKYFAVYAPTLTFTLTNPTPILTQP